MPASTPRTLAYRAIAVVGAPAVADPNLDRVCLPRQGTLVFARRDTGPSAAFMSADGEYKYRLRVGAEHVPTIVEALGGQPGDDVLALLEGAGENIVRGGMSGTGSTTSGSMPSTSAEPASGMNERHSRSMASGTPIGFQPWRSQP
ncbi:hypothetical protein [Georgenia subflava]|uniref:Uncharacterized protein n=1 Tax=Georgenia subflava TaxID=1622177 RepID=A0A6N7EHX5_9MICO|nr:hypothetical protein [Georgenia subflava]MPV36713.1 hypothetical protein [Georgenia subflava]